jgi:hypothetical protein
VRVESNDVFGEPVNIAARVEGLADAGEVYFTEAVYLAMNKAEVPSQEVGAFELKGIPGKIRVFRVPKGPYRMEAPVMPLPTPAGVPQQGPPFANLALSRVPVTGTSSAELAATAAVLGQRAVVLGGQAKSLGGRFMARASRFIHGLPERLPSGLRSRLPAGTKGPHLALGGGALALLLGVAVVALGKSPAERAIAQVEDAAPSKREALADKARRIIAEEKDTGRRNYLLGKLDEAQGELGAAVSHYKAAAKAGEDAAEERIVDMLEHPKCQARSAAAYAAGELKLRSALGELEDLADEEGPEDGASSGFLGLGGCNSRKAALEAIKRMGND